MTISGKARSSYFYRIEFHNGASFKWEIFAEFLIILAVAGLAVGCGGREGLQSAPDNVLLQFSASRVSPGQLHLIMDISNAGGHGITLLSAPIFNSDNNPSPISFDIQFYSAGKIVDVPSAYSNLTGNKIGAAVPVVSFVQLIENEKIHFEFDILTGEQISDIKILVPISTKGENAKNEARMLCQHAKVDH